MSGLELWCFIAVLLGCGFAVGWYAHEELCQCEAAIKQRIYAVASTAIERMEQLR